RTIRSRSYVTIRYAIAHYLGTYDWSARSGHFDKHLGGHLTQDRTMHGRSKIRPAYSTALHSGCPFGYHSGSLFHRILRHRTHVARLPADSRSTSSVPEILRRRNAATSYTLLAHPSIGSTVWLRASHLVPADRRLA